MSISISNNTQRPAPAAVPATATRDTAQRPAGKSDATTTDKVTLGAQPAEDGTYGNPRTAANATSNPTVNTTQSRPAEVAAMLEESSRKVKEIINLILPLIEQQGLNLAKVVSGEQKLTTDAATIEEAQAAIAEDGEFGIKAVAERILNFAKSAIGGDPSKLEAIRAAVEKGFKEATEMLGGALPEISQKTHKAIMAEFDRWQSDGIPETVDISAKANSPSAQAA